MARVVLLEDTCLSLVRTNPVTFGQRSTIKCHDVPGTVLGSWETAVNKTDDYAVCTRLAF